MPAVDKIATKNELSQQCIHVYRLADVQMHRALSNSITIFLCRIHPI